QAAWHRGLRRRPAALPALRADDEVAHQAHGEDLTSPGRTVTLTAPPLPLPLREPLREAMMTHVTVVIVDRDLLFSRGLELLLERVSGGAVRVVGHTSDGCGAVELVRRQRPDVAIVGLSLPAPGPLPVIRDLKRLYPSVPVIAMGGPGAGACGSDADTNG